MCVYIKQTAGIYKYKANTNKQIPNKMDLYQKVNWKNTNLSMFELVRDDQTINKYCRRDV